LTILFKLENDTKSDVMFLQSRTDIMSYVVY